MAVQFNSCTFNMSPYLSIISFILSLSVSSSRLFFSKLQSTGQNSFISGKPEIMNRFQAYQKAKTKVFFSQDNNVHYSKEALIILQIIRQYTKIYTLCHGWLMPFFFLKAIKQLSMIFSHNNENYNIINHY